MNNRIYADPGQNLYLTRWLKLVYEIKFDAAIRNHHFYKEIWTPQKDDIYYIARNLAWYKQRGKVSRACSNRAFTN